MIAFKFTLCALLVFISLSARAENDLLTAVKMFSNFASGGTYLADLEKEKQRIAANYAKKRAELEVKIQRDFNIKIKELYVSEILLCEERIKRIMDSAANLQMIIGAELYMRDQIGSLLKRVNSLGPDISLQISEATELEQYLLDTFANRAPSNELPPEQQLLLERISQLKQSFISSGNERERTVAGLQILFRSSMEIVSSDYSFRESLLREIDEARRSITYYQEKIKSL